MDGIIKGDKSNQHPPSPAPCSPEINSQTARRPKRAIFPPPRKRIRIAESSKFLLENPKSWAEESGIQLKDSGIQQRLGSGIQFALTKNPESSTWESGIHGVESRIQDCFGFPNMGRIFHPFIFLSLMWHRSKNTAKVLLDLWNPICFNLVLQLFLLSVCEILRLKTTNHANN